MKVVLIAKRYAKAALDILQPDMYEEILKEVKILRAIFDGHPEIKKFLSATIIAKHPKTALYYNLTSGFKHQEFWNSLFKVFIIKKRNNIVHQFFREFEHMIYEQLNTAYVRIFTAHNHDKQTLDTIQTYVETVLHKKTVYSAHIDKSLIGGFVAKTKERTIDASVKRNLNKFKRVAGG